MCFAGATLTLGVAAVSATEVGSNGVCGFGRNANRTSAPNVAPVVQKMTVRAERLKHAGNAPPHLLVLSAACSSSSGLFIISHSDQLGPTNNRKPHAIS